METSRSQLQELQSTGQGDGVAGGQYEPGRLKEMEELQRESQPRLDIQGRLDIQEVEEGRLVWARARKAAAGGSKEQEAATKTSDCPFPPLGGPVLQVCMIAAPAR